VKLFVGWEGREKIETDFWGEVEELFIHKA
jgi:hypothetical protein